ncbi:MAG: MFS transporter [Actinomycetota bacterium]|nr:MFS transporter [Actinomycetota bacterium]
MYSSLRDRPADAPSAAAVDGSGAPVDGVDSNVVALGVTSFFSDISSEMVNAVLPLYLMLTLGFTPLQFGLFDGAYQGMTGLLRIAGGLVADRRRRYKEVAGLGYGVSAVCKLGLLASRGWGVTAAVLLADRTGKGIRTAPRDALISLSSSKDRLAESFGVHRALDTAGALLGPVVAFVLLGVAPGAYDAVFVTSFCAALIGLGVLFCFVQNRSPAVAAGAAKPSWRDVAGLLAVPRFRRLVIAGGLLGLVTISDAFIYLVFQRRTGMSSRPFPLLFVGTALAYLALAVPLGRLADRLGRAPVFVAGHVILVGAYVILRMGGPGFLTVLLLLGLLGAYYAATDGVLMALASTALPPELRSSGLALLTTVTSLTRFAAALVFGLMWTWRGPAGAVVVFLVGVVVAVPVAARILFFDRRAVTA